MKSYTKHLRDINTYSQRHSRRLRSGLEDSSEEIVEDQFDEDDEDNNDTGFDSPMDVEDSAEWEVVGIQLPDVVDENLVEELQEKLGTDPLSENIRDGEELIAEADSQVEVLGNLKEAAKEKWDEYGDVSDEIASIDSGVEQRIKAIPRQQRTLARCLEAIDEQIHEIELGKATVEVVVVEKLIEHLNKKHTKYKAFPTKLRNTISKAQDKRVSMSSGPETTIPVDALNKITAAGDLATHIEKSGENGSTFREVSNAYVEMRTNQVSSRVIAACVNNPLMVEEIGTSIKETHDVFISQSGDLNIFLSGFDLVLNNAFTGDWETFRTVPFVKVLSEKTRETIAKMEQCPPVCSPISQIEKIETIGLTVAAVIETGLNIENDEFIKTLKIIEDALEDAPNRISTLEEAAAQQGEHLSSLLKEYVNNLRVLSQYMDEFCQAADVVISVVDGHVELFSELESAVD